MTRIQDKFEVDGTVQDVLKGRCGRKRSSTDNESADAVFQIFVVVGSVLWQKVDILNMYGFKEV